MSLHSRCVCVRGVGVCFDNEEESAYDRGIKKSPPKGREGVYKAIFDCPHLDKYTCNDSGCVTEYVGGTCVDLSPGYLYDCRSLEEVESIKPV